MEHFNPATAPSIHNYIVHNTSDTTYAGVRAPSVPQLNNSADDEYEWQYFGEDVVYGPSHPCYWLTEKVKNKFKKRLIVPTLEPYHDLSRNMISEINHLNTWSKCHLLSLPKELRLAIWRHVLTDLSTPELLVGIFREPSSPYKRHPRPAAPNFNVSLQRSTPINVNILQVNRLIYGEALPILYWDTRFAPWDLEGILPMFLDSLSPVARSCIRHIKLYLPQQVTSPTIRLDPSKPFFNWAITCAQVAKLNGSLQSVEVEGDWSIFDNKANRRAIVAPLLKIKANKTFTHRPTCFEPTADFSKEFEELLAETSGHLRVVANIRKERTKADALERAERLERLEQERQVNVREYNASQAQQAADEAAGKDHEMEEWRRFAEENIKKIEQELSFVPGIKQFERELTEHSSLEDSFTASAVGDHDDGVEEWDIVSVRSGATTPKARPGSVMSKASDETWTDTASTIVGKDVEGKKGDESDPESENWEQL
jgi:hypothetical protein